MTKRPVVLVVMDGIGIREDKKNNAVALANKPTLDKLWNECPHTQLRAHGLAVGLPTDGDMNSVGPLHPGAQVQAHGEGIGERECGRLADA